MCVYSQTHTIPALPKGVDLLHVMQIFTNIVKLIVEEKLVFKLHAYLPQLRTPVLHVRSPEKGL